MLTNKSFFAWSASLLNLSTDVNIFKEVDWTTNHVLFQRRLANRDVGIDSRLPETRKLHDNQDVKWLSFNWHHLFRYTKQTENVHVNIKLSTFLSLTLSTCIWIEQKQILKQLKTMIVYKLCSRPFSCCLFSFTFFAYLYVCVLRGIFCRFLCLFVCLFICLFICLFLFRTTSWWGTDKQNLLQTLRNMFQEDLCNHHVDHKMFQALLPQHLSYIARMYTDHDSTDHSECRRHFPLDSEHKETCGSIFLKNK